MTNETAFITVLRPPAGSNYLSIDDDFSLFEREGSTIPPHPYKVAAVLVVICIQGEKRGTHNLQPFVLKPQTLM